MASCNSSQSWAAAGCFAALAGPICPRYGDAHVSFLAPGGTRKWACSTARWRSSPERATGSDAARRCMLADHGAKVVVNDLGGSVTRRRLRQAGRRRRRRRHHRAGRRGRRQLRQRHRVRRREEHHRHRARRVRPPRHPREQRGHPARQDDVLDVARRLRRRRQGAHVRRLQHDAATPRSTGATSRRKAASPAPSIINTVSSAGLQGQASQINYGGGQGRRRGDDDHRQPRAQPLRRARQLHRPRWRHAHGRARR